MLIKKTLPSVPASSSRSSRHFPRKQKLSVVSIVGMGGLGKTSLAQLVYSDDLTIRHFEEQIWVCVSDKFDVYRILKEMMESFTDCSYCKIPSNLDVLARLVKAYLTGKKYLLVLDDLWNEDAGDWEKLHGVLVNGVKGSKLLVTTRSQKVSSVIGGKVHNLQTLTDNDCWSIMQKRISFPLPQNMIIIGRDIAKKCDGLPLAANFLGSLLHSRREEGVWVSINSDKDLWVQPENKRVISILKLSYDNLPSPLKQCFSYCCLFPKDWKIERGILIRMWMAEGFLQLPADEVNNRSFEDVGNDYFEFLLYNSFFQDIEKDELGVILKCKMHDLVHDLAMSIVDGNEFWIGWKEDVSQVRRLQLICDKGSSATTAKVLCKEKNLRTIVALDPENYSQIGSFSSAKHLRILYPVGVWGKKFSISVSKFKHLRFLDLSKCELDSSHDVSLNHSYDLQTLILHWCKNVSGFLGGIKHLKSLRHLDVSLSDIEVLPDDSIVYLTNLQTLNLENCMNFKALPENIGVLKHLSYLDLSYSSVSKIPDSITCISNLETLNIKNSDSSLSDLPTELGALTRLRSLDLFTIQVLPESCISNLCNLEIVKFGHACELPKEIKNWPKLRQFSFNRFRNDAIMPKVIQKLTCLETLDPYMVRKEAEDIQICRSDHHSGIEELAALNFLQVLYLDKLENVRGGIEDAERAKLKDKPDLRELYLSWRSLPTYKIKTNTEDPEDDDMVLEGLHPHHNLRRLEIHRFMGLNLPKWMDSSSICMLPNLVFLLLSGCNRCKILPALGMLPSLVTLAVHSMENVEEWVSPPSSVDSFPLLEDLEMGDCLKLRNAPNSTFPSLKTMRFLRTTGLAVAHSLYFGSRGRGGCLTSLISIYIKVSPGLQNFPLSVLLQHNTPNLYSLEIRDCYSLEGFLDDTDDLNNNSSGNSALRKLEIMNCPVLTSLPDLRLWTSLEELTIKNCENLNKESIPYNLKKSLSFIKDFYVDFI